MEFERNAFGIINKLTQFLAAVVTILAFILKIASS